MEIIPPVGDMRYESFLDKSKQDIVFRVAPSDPTFCNRNIWRAMRVILCYLFTFREFTSDVKINSISIIGGTDGTRYSYNLFSPVCGLANVDPTDVARNIAGSKPETTLEKQ
ncbi:unnamed protein product [Prunus brigantina]